MNMYINNSIDKYMNVQDTHIFTQPYTYPLQPKIKFAVRKL